MKNKETFTQKSLTALIIQFSQDKNICFQLR